MAAPLAKGLIVLAIVVVAAGAAAYENPQVRDWMENSRRKMAHSLHSLGDEVDPRMKRSRRNEPSMREDEAEAAEERRRRARAEIMEKGRIMGEKQRRKTSSRSNDTRSPTGSFDTLVDKDGMLKKNRGEVLDQRTDEDALVQQTHATTTAMDAEFVTEDGLKNRRAGIALTSNVLHQSVDAPLSLPQLPSPPAQQAQDPFETLYEREMRNTWRLPLSPKISTPLGSSLHESESLINLTPTSEFPDPDVVIPTNDNINTNTTYQRGAQDSLDQTDYFSTVSSSSHTLSEAAPNSPLPILSRHSFHQSGETQPQSQSQPAIPTAVETTSPSTTSSLSNSIDHISGSDIEISTNGANYNDNYYNNDNDNDEDGVLSDFDDGIATPESAWTDVGSVVSSEGGGQ